MRRPGTPGRKGADMSENKPSRPGFGGKGGYIALAMCMVAAGIVTLLAVGSPRAATPVQPAPQEGSVSVQQEEPRPTAPVLGPEKVETVTRPPEQNAVTEPVKTPEPEPAAPVLEPEELLPQVVSPLDGTTVTVFSMTELIYDETLADWRTHNGLDIQAGEGDAVKTAADGTVLSVSYDELMGATVVIGHEGGYTTQYSSLKTDPPVEVGQPVSAGQIIGFVGTTATAESSMGPHLHFSVSRDGQVIDPREYVG